MRPRIGNSTTMALCVCAWRRIYRRDCGKGAQNWRHCFSLDQPGKPDQGFRDSVYDRSGITILRIHGRPHQCRSVAQTVHLPPAFWQPIAADDVASALAEVTLAAPVNGMI